MTHDELVSICDNYTFKDSGEPVRALRAVVELHADNGFGDCRHCQGLYGMGEAYPCPTIQAIEKELV